ncbi:MAG: hypothetical protein ACRC8W_04120 [Plesiomonas shigelloides]
MIRKADGTHNQTTASSEWSIVIPDGRLNVELFGVYSEDGRTSIPYDSYDLTNGVMTIYFGIDQKSGVARYEYDVDGNDGGSTCITGTGGTVQVTVHQYNGVPQPQP